MVRPKTVDLGHTYSPSSKNRLLLLAGKSKRNFYLHGAVQIQFQSLLFRAFLEVCFEVFLDAFKAVCWGMGMQVLVWDTGSDLAGVASHRIASK